MFMEKTARKMEPTGDPRHPICIVSRQHLEVQMKLTWMTTTLFLLSVNAFAQCPPGTQGSSSFTEAQSTLKRNLGETLNVGSSVTQTNGGAYKIVFGELNGQLRVTAYKAGRVEFGPFTTLICSGGGATEAVAGKYNLDISKDGGALSVTIDGFITLGFNNVAGGSHPVAVAAAPSDEK
jgi:hypothetical protein